MKKKEKLSDLDEEEEMDIFADEVIKKEMKRLNNGHGMESDEELEDLGLSELDNDELENNSSIDMDKERKSKLTKKKGKKEESEDFFEDEDLSDVDLGNNNEGDDGK